MYVERGVLSMKVIIAHPAQQHSFRLATALKKAGILDKYATTVYLKKRSLTQLVTFLLRGKFRERAFGRKNPDLSAEEVIQFCEGEGLLRLLVQNIPVLRKYHSKIRYHVADRFAGKVVSTLLTLIPYDTAG